MRSVERITIEGFKSIDRLEELPLKSINILIGPNGSGKSNFIGVFSLLNEIRQGRLRNYVARSGGADKILHFGSRNTDFIKIHIWFHRDINQYLIELSPNDMDELFPSKETAYFWNQSGFPDPYDKPIKSHRGEAGISRSEISDPIIKYVQEHLDCWRIYHFHDTGTASPMKKRAKVNDNRFLRADGSNLASFLFFLKKKDSESYDMIRRTVRLVAPFFDDFQLEPLALKEDTIHLEWRHRGTDAYFDASSLSDGTLRFIALATLLLHPPPLRPSTIIMDEPELGLHPYAITLLASLIKQAAQETQIILATQSSLLIDHFDPDDVLVANRVSGATEFTRLESGKLRDWLKIYSLGQLWEKNELGDRPVSES